MATMQRTTIQIIDTSPPTATSETINHVCVVTGASWLLSLRIDRVELMVDAEADLKGDFGDDVDLIIDVLAGDNFHVAELTVDDGDDINIVGLTVDDGDDFGVVELRDDDGASVDGVELIVDDGRRR